MENLYLIKCNEFYKIGIATDLKSRLAQLQTGNPYTLAVVACFQYPNALIVEKAIHQKFNAVHTNGEWFQMGDQEITEFLEICRMLGGVETSVLALAEVPDVEEAESIQDAISEQGSWDYQQMFRDGWRMEPSSSRSASDKYWAWRRSKNGNREYIYGGRIVDLPFPDLAEMRRIFRDGKLYQPYLKSVGNE